MPGKRLAKLALSLGLLAWLLRLVDVGDIGAVLAGANPTWLAAAFVLYVAGQGLSAWKWRVIAGAVGFHRPARSFIAYYFIGMFFNAFGLGTVGGDVMRAFCLAGGTRRGMALNTVIVDRLNGLLVLVALAFGALLLFRTYELPGALYWTTLALAGAILTGWWLAPILAPAFLPSGNRVRRLVEQDLAPYWGDYRLLARASALSLVFHLSQVGVLALLATALHLEIPATYFFVFGPLVNLFSALPISWNGLGIREGGYVFFLGHIGVGREVAVAFGLVWLGVVLLASAVGGFVYVTFRDGALPDPAREAE